MIGSYRGSSRAELALKRIVEAMVMPAGVTQKLSWPVFPAERKPLLLMTYRRADSDYQHSQQGRLLELNAVPFEIFIWSENENLVALVMDALEAGCNAYPLKDGVYAVRAQLEGLHETGGATAPAAALDLARGIGTALGNDYSAKAQDEALAKVNLMLAGISGHARMTGRADWMTTLDELARLQGELRVTPVFNIQAMGCRDLTAPEVWQLGLSGRVFVAGITYGSANEEI